MVHTVDTIHLLQKVVQDENCKNNMNMSTVKGFLGELIVKEKLEEADIEVKPHGNQSGYDLLFQVKGKDFKIDVKTSTLKDEFSCSRNHWGWALIPGSKKKPVTATHFICVGLDENYEASQFIIIPKALANKCPKGIGQFKGVKRALCVFPNQRHPDLGKLSHERAKYITDCGSVLQNKSIKILRRGQSFRSLFR